MQKLELLRAIESDEADIFVLVVDEHESINYPIMQLIQ